MGKESWCACQGVVDLPAAAPRAHPPPATLPRDAPAIRPIPAGTSLEHAGRGCQAKEESRMDALLSLSNDLAAAVERARGAVVAVNARPRLPPTGVHWRPGIIVTADHTVRSDDDITIIAPDGRTGPASLV